MAGIVTFPVEQQIYSWLISNISRQANASTSTFFPSTPPSEALRYPSLQNTMLGSFDLGFDLPLQDVSVGLVVLLALQEYVKSPVSIFPSISRSLGRWKVDILNIILLNVLKTLLGLALMLVMVPLVLPVLVVLWLASLAAKFVYILKFGSKVTKADGMDSLWGMESKESRPFITACILVAGQPDLKKIQSHVMAKVLNLKDASGRDYRFPKFRQVFMKECGYYCWRDADHFNIEEHVRVVDLRTGNNGSAKLSHPGEVQNIKQSKLPDLNCDKQTQSKFYNNAQNGNQELYNGTKLRQSHPLSNAAHLGAKNGNQGLFNGMGVNTKGGFVERNSAMDDLVQQVVSEEGGVALDADRPPWELLLLVRDDDRYNVVMRLHHAIGDGVSFIRLCLEALVDTPLPPPPVGSPPPCAFVRAAMMAWSLIVHPLGLLQVVANFDRNSLHGPTLSGRKIMTWSKSIPLQLVRDIKNATHTTVNDVLMSSLASALSSHFAKRREIVHDVTAVMPLSFHNLQAPLTLTNCFSVATVKLPALHTLTPLNRLHATKRLLDEVKRDPTLLAVFGLVREVSRVLPACVASSLLSGSGITLGASNVPGPQQEITIWGDAVEDLVFWVPNRAPVGAGVSFFSYNGRIRVGFNVDEALVGSKREAQQLIEGVEEELNRLHHTLHPSTQ